MFQTQALPIPFFLNRYFLAILGFPPLQKLAGSLLILVLIFNPILVLASSPVDGLVAEGSTDTSVDRAPNGTPLLNIANADGSGRSYNRFVDYNVTPENLVINNFRASSSSDVGVSNLGGVLPGNPNFNGVNGRAADVIINEVVSNKISRIEGYTEIFGKRADLIIANPNGIMIAGGGFINTAKLSLITGSSQNGLADYGNNNKGPTNNFNINPNAQILITAKNVLGKDGNNNDVIIPLGLDASEVDYTNLISRIVKVQGNIYANNLDIITGNNQATRNNEDGNWRVNSLTNDLPLTTKPELAIDASYLGAMYAGRINLIATEAGVGVKTAGDLIADVGDININSLGNVSYQNLTSHQGDINIIAGNNSNLSSLNDPNSPAVISAKNNVNLSSGTINNSGLILALNNLSLTANNLNNNNASISAHDINFNLTGIEAIISGGNIVANHDININSSSSLSNSAILDAANDLSISAYEFYNANKIQGVRQINFKNITNLINRDIIQGNQINFLNVNNISNYGADALIYSINNLDLNNLDNLSNSGNISSHHNLSIDSNYLVNSGVIHSDGNNNITGTNLNNYGIIEAIGDLTLGFDNDFNNHTNSIITSNGALNISLNSGNLTNSGLIQGVNHLNFNHINNLTNHNIIQSNNLTFNNISNITNSGINAQIYSVATLNINNLNNLTNFEGAIISSANDLNISSNIINNNSQINAQNIVINANNNFNNDSDGLILAVHNLNLTARSISNANTNHNPTDLDTGNLIFNYGLVAGYDLSLKAAHIENTNGFIFSGNDLNIDLQDNNFTNSGLIQGVNHLNFSNITNLTNHNIIQSNNLTFNNVSNINNSGVDALIYSVATLNINNLNNLTNDNDAIITSANDLNISTNSINNGSQINANNINISSNLNNLGILYANGDLSIIANNGNITNTSGQIIANNINLDLSGSANAAILGGNINAANNINITNNDAHNSLSNSAKLSADNDLNINLGSGNLTNLGLIQGTNHLNFNNITNLTNQNIIQGSNLTFNNISNITNQGLSPEAQALIYGINDVNLLNLISFTNGGNATIASQNNLNFTATNLTNFGIIQSSLNTNITTTESFNNNNLIYAGNNLSIITSNSDLNNNVSGIVAANNNLTLIARTLNNSNQIASAGSADINLTGDLNNNDGALLLSLNNLSINTHNLINSGSISASNNLILITGENLTNNQTLFAGNNLNATANSITNSGSIQATKNINITSNSFDNSGSKAAPSQTQSKGVISNNGSATINSKTINNNNGFMLAANSLSLADNSTNHLNLNNTSGYIASGTNTDINLGTANDYTITGTILSDGDLGITANNITNLGDVSAVNINLNANGNINNGSIWASTNANNNTRLAATNNLNLTANNTINNYGILTAANDLSLTSNNSSINNYNQILGGSGVATISATQGEVNSYTTLNSNAKISSDNNLIINAINLNNNALIQARNNFTANITNNLNNNQSAYIYAGNNINFYVNNNLTNNQADIYAENNLTIQGINMDGSSSPCLGGASLCQQTMGVYNISGSIETYLGDINIKANTLTNAVSTLPTQGAEIFYRIEYVPGGVYHKYFRVTATSGSQAASLVSGNNLTLNVSGTLWNNASSIIAKNNTNINVGILKNNSYIFRDYVIGRTWSHFGWGNIGVGWCAYLGVGCGEPGGYFLTGTKDGYVNQAYRYNALIKSGGNLTLSSAGTITNNTNDLALGLIANGADTVSGSSGISVANNQDRSTTINNINLTTLAQTGKIDIDYSRYLSSNDKIPEDNSAAYNSNISNNNSASNPATSNLADYKKQITLVSNDAQHPFTQTNNDPAITSDNNPITSTDNKAQSIAPSTPSTNNKGAFIENVNNPNSEYLFESRTDFLDKDKFFGSSYYFTLIGFNPVTIQAKLLGDAAFENRIIRDQLQSLRRDSMYLSDNETDANNEIRSLFDNAVAQKDLFGLEVGKALTDAQRKSLTSDIIWMEETTINGQKYLVPKLYLSETSLDKLLGNSSPTTYNSQLTTNIATNSTIFSNNNLTFNLAGDFSNINSSIIAKNNLNLIANNIFNTTTITNNQSLIKSISGNNTLIATNDISNIGSNIKANNQINLIAGNNITNKALINYNINGVNYSNSENLNDLGQSQITLTQTNINHKGYATQTTTINTTVEDMVLTSNANNIKSTLISQGNIESGGNLTISAGNNFNNIGSTISTEQSATIETASGDINITTATLRDKTTTVWGNRKKGGISVTDTVTNVGSNINADGNITLVSGVDTNIVGSNITADGSGIIQTGGDLNIMSAQDNSYKYTANWKKGSSTFGANSNSSSSATISITNVASNVNVGGDLLSNSQDNINILASNLASEKDINLIAKNDINIVSGQNYSYTQSANSKKGSTVRKSSTDIDYKLTNVASNLETNGDVNIASGRDTNIIASNLSGTNGNIIVGKYTDLNASSPTFNQEIVSNDAKLTIKSGEDLHYKYHQQTKIKTDSTAIVVGAVAAAAVVVVAVVAAPGTAGASTALIASAPQIGAAAAGGAATGAQGKKGKTTTTEMTEITQIKSNLNFTGDLNTQSSGDTVIKASNISSDNATIFTGKFRDQNTGVENVVNADSKIKLESAFDTKETKTTVDKVKPNYVGIAAVSAGSVYVGGKLNTFLTSKGLPYVIDAVSVVGGIASTKNINPNNSGGSLDFLYNVRSKKEYNFQKQTEIKTNLNFNNLTIE